jgi:hypothetical protein
MDGHGARAVLMSLGLLGGPQATGVFSPSFANAVPYNENGVLNPIR